MAFISQRRFICLLVSTVLLLIATMGYRSDAAEASVRLSVKSSLVHEFHYPRDLRFTWELRLKGTRMQEWQPLGSVLVELEGSHKVTLTFPESMPFLSGGPRLASMTCVERPGAQAKAAGQAYGTCYFTGMDDRGMESDTEPYFEYDRARPVHAGRTSSGLAPLLFTGSQEDPLYFIEIQQHQWEEVEGGATRELQLAVRFIPGRGAHQAWHLPDAILLVGRVESGVGMWESRQRWKSITSSPFLRWGVPILVLLASYGILKAASRYVAHLRVQEAKHHQAAGRPSTAAAATAAQRKKVE